MSRILVVDDDVDLRESLAEALVDAGHEAITARDGREALERLHDSSAFDLVVLDLMMPVMTGWEFRSAQLAEPSLADIPVVVMTAAADTGKSPITAAAYLRKPVTLARMLEVVATHARRA